MKKILVVDDEPEIRAAIKEVLKEQFSVVTANDGDMALEAVRQEKPDLILTDVLMPKVSGYNFYKNLKKEKTDMSDIPLIVMSGRPSMQEFFDNWSIVSFLNKPFKAEELLASVQRALSFKKGDASTSSGKASAPSVPQSTAAGSAKKQRLALVATVEESVTVSLKKFLEFKNFAIETALSADEIYQIALKRKPHIVICQYWEDASIFDAAAARKLILESEATHAIPFVPICMASSAKSAEKVFGADNFVTFDSMRELREKIEMYLY